jgi:hypothetical protein
MKKTLLFLLALAGLGIGQTKTMDRKYVPIVIKGSQIPRVNLLIREWTAFCFHTDQNIWTRVPFQVDEVCSAHGKYNHEDGQDGIISAQDELLIMPEDLGDRAPADQWLDDPNSKKETRIELSFIDPRSAEKKGWLYLYKNISTDQAPSGYHRYVAAPAGTAADTAKTNSYTIGHNKDGWIDFVSFAAAPHKDVVDRLKLRFAGETLYGSLGKYVCSEDTLNNGSSSYHPGIVRAFHDQRTLFALPKLWPSAFNADYQIEYFPSSFRIGAFNVNIDKLALAMFGLKSLRQSLDLSAEAAGGKFYSSANPDGVLIDGTTDVITTALTQTSGAQWVLASGSWGTILMILDLPQIKNSITKVYYRDNAAGGTMDGSLDSGDLVSYGDMGLWVYTLASALVTDRINIDFACYFINEPDHNAVFAQQVFDWNQQAPVLAYLEQTYSATGVRSSDETPDDFTLAAGYPNPFNPLQSMWQAVLHTPGLEAQCDAAVYNVLGQAVAVLGPFTATARSTLLTWDGRMTSGLMAPAGLYFIQVHSNGHRFLQRIMVAR